MSATRGRRGRGATLVELVLSLTIFASIVAATAALMNAGQQQQRLGSEYSRLQTDLRTALRRITRTVRHGRGVVMVSETSAFRAAGSGAGQIIVAVPEPSRVTPAQVEVRIYAANNTLYAQRSDQAAPGTVLLTGVRSLTFNYYQTVGTSRAAVDATPGQATETQVTLSAAQGRAITSATTTVALRNVVVTY